MRLIHFLRELWRAMLETEIELTRAEAVERLRELMEADDERS